MRIISGYVIIIDQKEIPRDMGLELLAQVSYRDQSGQRYSYPTTFGGQLNRKPTRYPV
jgi:hypothetical protein